MLRQPFREPNLVIPIESLFRVRGELDVVGWVGIKKVVRFHFNLLKIAAGKFPIAEDTPILTEIALIVDAFVPAEWNVEPTARIEAAQPVVASAIEIVEKRRGLCRFDATI